MNGPMAASYATVELGWQRERIARMTAGPVRRPPRRSWGFRRRNDAAPRARVREPRPVGALAR